MARVEGGEEDGGGETDARGAAGYEDCFWGRYEGLEGGGHGREEGHSLRGRVWEVVLVFGVC